MPRRRQKKPGGGDALVPRDEYERALFDYMREHPFSKAESGRENPYTGRKITSQAEQEEYCRERVFRDICENNALRSARGRAILAVFVIVAALVFVAYSFHEVWYGGDYAQSPVNAPAASASPDMPASPSPAPADSSAPDPDMDPDATVYISRSGKIHLEPDCSGMESYEAMTYSEACAAGYEHCKACFGQKK